jgi:hypothetical protein
LKRRVRELEMELAESRQGGAVRTRAQDVPHPWPRGSYASNPPAEPVQAHEGPYGWRDDRSNHGPVEDDDGRFREKSVRFADESTSRSVRLGGTDRARLSAGSQSQSHHANAHPRARAYGETLHDWAHDEREGGDGSYIGHPLDVSHAPPQPALYSASVRPSHHTSVGPNEPPNASAASVRAPMVNSDARGSREAEETSPQKARDTSAMSADHSMSPVTPGRPADELLMSDLDQTEDDWLHSRMAAAQYVMTHPHMLSEQQCYVGWRTNGVGVCVCGIASIHARPVLTSFPPLALTCTSRWSSCAGPSVCVSLLHFCACRVR